MLLLFKSSGLFAHGSLSIFVGSGNDPKLHRSECEKKSDPRGDDSDQRKEFDLDNTARLKKRTQELEHRACVL